MKKYFTKINLVSFLFYFVFTGIGLSLMNGWRAGIPSEFIGAVIFFLFMPWMQKINMKSMIKMLKKMNAEDEESAIFCGGANHFKGLEGVGGKMVLFHDAIVFKSHKVNIQKHELRIEMQDIANASAYAVWGLFPTGLQITTAAGNIEKFIVGNRQEWIDGIYTAKTLAA